MKKNFSFWVALCVASLFIDANAKVWFENPSINGENKIVYSVRSASHGSPDFKTGFISDAISIRGLASKETEIITCFPESLAIVGKNKNLQVTNRYGTARYDSEKNSLNWISKANSIPSEAPKISPFAVSPDGLYLCYVRKTGSSTGSLILRNNESMQERVILESTDFSYENLPVKWAKDGSAFVYEKEGSVYFCEPKSAFEFVQFTESFRKVGWGSLNSVYWCGNRTLIYVDRDLVYRINSKELFTRGLYAPLVGIGEVCGRLPVNFNSATDKFWVNDNADAMVVIQSNSIVSSFKMNTNGYAYVETQYSAPFTDMRGIVLDYNVFWDTRNEAILWVNVLALEDGAKRCSVYRVNNELKLLMSMGDVGLPVLSPDGKKIAFSAGTTLFVYDIESWRNSARLNGEKLVSYVWNGNNRIFAGGESTVRQWDLDRNGGSEKMLFLSSLKTFAWVYNNYGDDSLELLADTKDYEKRFFKYLSEKGVWEEKNIDEPLFMLPSATVQNGRFRVFAGNTANPRYENALFVRNLVGKAVTKAVFPETVVPEASRKKVALVFDASESADGLSKILNTLKGFNVPGTFFVNGEFVRRYPKESKQIKVSGHECGSLFFTNVELNQKGFVIDEEFIVRGLARSEDDFFAATGEELSLFWHAPYYKASEKMIRASERAGYTYIDAGNLSFDTVTFEDTIRLPVTYMTAAEIIDRIVSNATDGSVIPVSVGLSRGSRNDYLYEKLDLLIAALYEAGFEIVNLREIVKK